MPVFEVTLLIERKIIVISYGVEEAVEAGWKHCTHLRHNEQAVSVRAVPQ